MSNLGKMAPGYPETAAVLAGAFNLGTGCRVFKIERKFLNAPVEADKRPLEADP
jgi:hypothetical protein